MIKVGDRVRNKILKFIINYITTYGYSPSYKEIGEAVGLSSTSTIHSHLNKMLETGMIETDVGIGVARAIRVPGYKFVKIDEVQKDKNNENKQGLIKWK